MIQTVNFPISKYCIQPYGSWENLKQKVLALGLDGVEAIEDPDDLAPDFPADLAAGFHMIFYPDWLDFWHQDESALLRKFGSWEMVEKVYRGTKPEDLLRQFREDLAMGQSLKTPYMVFHVSDVSLGENYTYRWEHTNKEVLDGAIEFINHLLWKVEPTFDFLVENQWWPGFTFTDPAETEYLLAGIEYPRVGIMLDTGHLMNANTAIRTQADGIQWVLQNIGKHGALAKRIKGLHFHQSVSGDYVRGHVGIYPDCVPRDYFEGFSANYAHVQRIDRHDPWTVPEAGLVVHEIAPKYLTHELANKESCPQLVAAQKQIEAIQKGFQLL